MGATLRYLEGARSGSESAQQVMTPTEEVQLVYAVGAVAVSVLAACRLSRCKRIKCGCIEVDRDVRQGEAEGEAEGRR